MAQTLSSSRRWRCELSVPPAQSATPATPSPAPPASWPITGIAKKLFGLPPYPLRGTEREFLEAVGYYNLWIPGLIEIAKPLDSNVTKPFHLHVSEIKGITKGVLIQTLDPWKRPVAYLSKRLDPMVAGWPACLRAVATTALLMKEADK
ncbi:hypothetical protein QTO34_007962 [Cnephaeus nilssonii]|uniref:Uncharacterized protein n=1 Tax=Cnephaeus nilssonii TaxID=3371016 RepID=A0AA40I9L1_CNENI|nr:hypothetical protein QTO34_007962 [Eptesicus nilssonii]